jgi:mannose-6-phosphate isomerase-like protein (cupin superfamily)
MLLTRREISLLMPAFAAAATAAAQTPAAQTPAATEIGGSETFRYEDLPVRPNGPGSSRQMLRTRTHSGYRLEIHETELPGGTAPHPPHQHVHEELMLIREGTMDVTIAGKTTQLGPGSCVYIASNQMHGWRNAGTGVARYFVLALGEDKA